MAKKTAPNDAYFDEQAPIKSQDFGSLFEQSLARTEKILNVGDQLRAEILTIGKEESFVSTGTPLDAIIFTADLLDENKKINYKAGDVIDIVIVRVKPEEIRATRKGSKSAPVDIDNLEDAFDMELPVEGKVTEVVNGGYRVSVQGQAAFCPISQLDTKPIVDPAAMIGKKFEFMITRFEPKQRNIVVSRRRLLDAQRAENEGAWIQSHAIGDIVEGLVTRIEQYGAFVEVAPNIEGLVHVSEIGYVRLKHAADGVHIGDRVQVKILNIDEGDRLKISLSIRQAGGVGDPWMQVPQQYPVGTMIDGLVDKKESFGLFIVIAPGINGLLPRSKWRDAVDNKIYENARKGDTLKVRIDEIKFEDRKISLGLPVDEDDPTWREHVAPQKSLGSLASAFSQAKGKKD